MAHTDFKVTLEERTANPTEEDVSKDATCTPALTCDLIKIMDLSLAHF